MNAVELKVLEVKLPEATFNEVEIANYIDGVLEKYEGLVFTDETVKDCKTTVAELNKMAKGIDKFRLDRKKEMSEPITEFEKKCKMLVAKIEDVVEPLKMQADNFEIKRREEKRQEVMGYIDEVLEIIKLEAKWADQLVLKEEWLNATQTKSKVKKAITEDAEKLLADQKSYYDKKEVVITKCELYSMRLELQVKLVPDSFFYMLDNYDGPQIDERILQIAEKQKAAEVESMERIRKEEEAKANAKAQVEIDKVKADTDQKIEEVNQVVASAVESVQAFIPVEKEEDAKTYVGTFKCRGTKAQLEALVSYMDACGIQFTKL